MAHTPGKNSRNFVRFDFLIYVASLWILLLSSSCRVGFDSLQRVCPGSGDSNDVSGIVPIVEVSGSGIVGCSAVQFEPGFFLTAAHCVDGVDASKLRLNFAEPAQGTGFSWEAHVLALSVHPRYLAAGILDAPANVGGADLAVLRADKAFPVSFELSEIGPIVGEEYSVFGYNGDESDTLLAGRVAFAESVDAYALDESEQVAEIGSGLYYLAPVSGRIAYSSLGGPLLQEQRVAGISSFGEPVPCEQKSYTAYTAVAPYATWIRDTATQLGAFTLDVDGNGSADSDTDGLLVIRFLTGFTGSVLVNGAVAGDATRSTEEIENYLDGATSAGVLDIDGNGEMTGLTDGLLCARFLDGLRGAVLVDSAVALDATRTTEQIEAYLTALLP